MSAATRQQPPLPRIPDSPPSGGIRTVTVPTSVDRRELDQTPSADRQRDARASTGDHDVDLVAAVVEPTADDFVLET
jgi:hypothetical protein